MAYTERLIKRKNFDREKETGIINFVEGHGPQPANLALIGEGPGATENAKGIPFCGVSGRELNLQLRFEGIMRENIRVENLVNYRVPDDENPSAEDIERDKPYLIESMLATRPRVVGLLGAQSTKYFIGDYPIDAVHGNAYRLPWPKDYAEAGLDYKAIFVSSYHPAAALHNPEVAPHFASDIRKLANVYRAVMGMTQRMARKDVPVILDSVVRDEHGEYDLQVGWRDLEFTDVAVDTEGFRGKPYCMSYSYKPGFATVILADDKEALRSFQKAVAARGVRVILHNAMYDIPILREMGVVIRDEQIEDTMVRAYLLRTEPQGLKPLALRHLQLKMNTYEDVTQPYHLAHVASWLYTLYTRGETGLVPSTWQWSKSEEICEIGPNGMAKVKRPHALRTRVKAMIKSVESENPPTAQEIINRWDSISPEMRLPVEEIQGRPPEFSFDMVPRQQMLDYSGEDAANTLLLTPVLREMTHNDGLDGIYDIDMGVVPLVEHMQANGMLADKAMLEDLGAYCDREAERVRCEIEQMVGVRINPGSGDQVAWLLFEKLGLTPRKLTKGGDRPSTDMKVLEAMTNEHPVMKLILEERRFNKVKDSFVTAIIDAIEPDGRVRCNLRITRVHSGRLAANSPNMLAIPVRTAIGRRIRQCFPAPEGHEMCTWDLSQIEMCEMADQSGDEFLIKLFREGRDMHAETAARMFGIPLEKVDKKKHRDPAKRVAFGVITGITGMGLRQQFEMNGVFGYSDEDCDNLIADWFKVYPGVKAFLQHCRAEARRLGYAIDRWGRKRDLPGIHSSVRWVREEAERQSHSHRISASSQGTFKRGMKRVWNFMKYVLHPEGIDLSFCLQIHDEMVGQIPLGHREEIGPAISDILCADRHLYKVPLKANYAFAPNWGDLEK